MELQKISSFSQKLFFQAEVCPERGFVLSNPTLPEVEGEVMVVAWPGQRGQSELSETTVGTLSHPSGALLYNFNRLVSTTDANVYNVHKVSQPFFKLIKEQKLLLPLD